MKNNKFNPSKLITPTVIERGPNGFQVYDIYSRLLRDRIIFLGTDIDDEVSNIVVAQLLFLEQDDSDQDIYLYINSPGGSVSAGFAIYDTMNYISSEVNTICVGVAASMAAILLSNGTKGKRSMLPNSKVMIHQPSSGFEGRATDIEIATKEILKIKKLANKVLAENTGQDLAKVEKDAEHDYWMDVKEALKYGIVDNLLEKRDIKKDKANKK